MQPDGDFFNLYQHGFIRAALAVPEVRVADPAFNAARTIELMQQAEDARALLAVFPELGLTAYSCEDLFHQQALLDGAQEALGTVLEATRQMRLMAAVGLPLRVHDLLFNCAAVLHQGRILGVVPKAFLPNYREYYEMRQFAPAVAARRRCVSLCGQENVPFGDRLLFRVDAEPAWTFFVEICEDLWVPIPPSSYAAMAGATVLVNLSASNVTISKDEYRHSLAANQSARCLAAYLYTAAGAGESTTDLAWDGHAMAYENGFLVAESERFRYASQLVLAELDVERLSQERMRQTTFGQSLQVHSEETSGFREVRVPVELPSPHERLLCGRAYDRFPYVPANPQTRDRRCYEAYNIQVQGLVQRLRSTAIDNLVIGISGGLDSTHALIVAARAMDVLGLPRSNIKGYTMPGFATSSRTLGNAHTLMRAIGCEAHELDIRPSCEQMLRDLGHPLADKPWPPPPAPDYDVTFENVQAGGAHQPPVSPGQPLQRPGGGHGRPQRAGARLVHVRGRRSHVALQRQCQRAQDPDPLPDQLGGRNRAARRRGQPRAARRARDRGQPRAGARRGGRRAAQPADRGSHRPLRAARLLPLLHHPSRLPA